mmetsp:Transcript_3049/g.6120  ORF Transcript_3049/g.6120 Transcript_3049/m.6120 type:complete len:132 (-) Transcript_3049:321-716(-)
MEDKTNKPYSSTNGCAHACGHDGHIAIMLGFCQWLDSHLNEISACIHIKCIFQPAEESGNGARQMIDAGLNKFDVAYGLHNVPSFPLGQIHVKRDAIMAGCLVFELQIRGKGGHGSTPHLVKDPVFIVNKI